MQILLGVRAAFGGSTGYRMNDSVAAVIVTYNRRELLRECLAAVRSQTLAVETILLIDNASTDGTPDMLRDEGYLNLAQFRYVRMSSNTGGAGGFYEGVRLARESGCGWLWLMDDDTIPAPECLEELLAAGETLAARKERISFLASCVYGPGGECLNVPKLDRRHEANGSEGWYRHLKDGLLQIESATFVSILIRCDAVRRCGLPCREYYIWGDDVEYTNRLTHYYGKAYLVGRGTAVHKRANTAALNIAYENSPDRIRMFHYDYRNQAINNRFYRKGMGVPAGICRNLLEAAHLLRREHGWLKARTIMKGTLEALVQYPHFRDTIEKELRTGEGSDIV